MIKTEETVDLAQESRPVREVIKAGYGVSYREDPNDGGSANVRIKGESYYMSPGRNMRKDELELRQKKERASKVQEYQKSRKGEFTSSYAEEG